MDHKSKRRAVAVKKVMAAAAFQFSIDDEGRISTGEVASWNEFDWGDEEAVVAQLFDYLRAHEDKPIVTFGGLGTDIPVLLLCSIANGLRLPPQLADRPGRRGPRPHLDLGLQIKGGGKTWSHLSQVLLRMGVPFNLVAAKPGVRRPVSAGAWQDLRNHVELDCLLLAIPNRLASRTRHPRAAIRSSHHRIDRRVPASAPRPFVKQRVADLF